MTDLMTVLEGQCPDNCGDLVISHIGGYPEWLDDDCPYDKAGVPSITTWERPTLEWDGPERVADNLQFDNVGAVGFKCPNGHEYWVEQTPCGDWVGP